MNECAKCGYRKTLIDYEGVLLCEICATFASGKNLQQYISQKIDSSVLETFRDPSVLNVASKQSPKELMQEQFSQGIVISRPPRGYKIIDKKLVIDPVIAPQVKELFTEFVDTPLSLNQFAKKHQLSTPGLQKLLQNRVYLGYQSMHNQEQKSHEPVISEELFVKIQEKLKR